MRPSHVQAFFDPAYRMLNGAHGSFRNSAERRIVNALSGGSGPDLRSLRLSGIEPLQALAPYVSYSWHARFDVSSFQRSVVGSIAICDHCIGIRVKQTRRE